jgi:aminocarboxymuconate-semialdehyde decarboxylase
VNSVRIDAHSHLYPRSYLDLLRAREQPPLVLGELGDERLVIFESEVASGGRPIGEPFWDVGSKLAFMAHHGIDRSIISLGNPWLDPFPHDSGVELARGLNMEFARLSDETGGRLVGMGVLPQADVIVAVEMIREIAEEPGLCGVVSGTRLCGRGLDDPALEPIWQALADRKVPMLLHPHYAVGPDSLEGYRHLLPVALGFPFETTLAVTRMTLAGVFERHPSLIVIASHGGGAMPYLLGRIDAVWRSAPTLARISGPPSESAKRLFLDAILSDSRSLRLAAETVGADHLLFGTDHPFAQADPEREAGLIAGTFAERDAEEILAGTATRLFGLVEGSTPVQA